MLDFPNLWNDFLSVRRNKLPFSGMYAFAIEDIKGENILRPFFVESLQDLERQLVVLIKGNALFSQFANEYGVRYVGQWFDSRLQGIETLEQDQLMAYCRRYPVMTFAHALAMDFSKPISERGLLPDKKAQSRFKEYLDKFSKKESK